MLFTAPAFAFLFLPFSLMFFMIFGKKQKRICFLVISLAYYVLLNLNAPHNMVVLPMLLIYTFFAQITAEKYGKKWLTTLLCMVPFVALIGLRVLAYMRVPDYVYPVGTTLPTLCSISYIWDCRSEKDIKSRFLKLTSYIFFFPLMILGPFVSFNDFCSISDEQNTQFSLMNVADGARLYMIGFVKRIAVGAVLIEAYQQIFAYSWDTQSFVTVILLLVLIYFGTFFSISGYYDMGVGVARMFGFTIPEINTNPFTIATLNEYSQGLFGSFRDWVKRYVLIPLFGSGHIPPLVSLLTYCIFIVSIIRSEPVILLICVPLFVFSLATTRMGLDKRGDTRGKAGLRMVFGVLTMLVVSVLWVFATMGNGMIFEDLAVDVGNAEYQTDMMLISFSWIKLLVVIVLGACTIIPRTKTAERITDGLPPTLRAVRDYSSMLIMLVIFLFTVVFFLPQFEAFTHVPFNYIVM
ncbi:MAG: hypothetical protein E7653_05495 [Ruminococcaceae bacterium]|nr:hypothetical protein [Oscillospiraceae bacterium]